VTGLLLAFLIVNGVGVRELTTVLLRTIALSSVGVSLGGLAQMFLANHGVGAFERGSRLESFLGNPVVLAVYLVLGLPLLLAEVMAAGDRRGARDFWIVCATISFVGIFLTQTRVSLVALLVTAGVFFCRRLRYAALFLTAFTLALGVLVASGLPRFTPAGVTSEVGQWVREYGDDFRGLPVTTWLIGDARLIPDLLVTSVPEPAADDTDEIPNMHLTLLRGHGILGWFVLIGTVLAALRVMKRAHDRTRVTSTRHTLWAIISAILGFLVSMHGTNAFHHLAIQVFFWSLVGIGLALAIDEGSPRRRNLIWRFAEAGD
jgi:hypothetical protein